jgi:hypothetical protein
MSLTYGDLEGHLKVSGATIPLQQGVSFNATYKTEEE